MQRIRTWWVIAKPYPHPPGFYKYKEVDGPFTDPKAAAAFVATYRPVESWQMVTIYSKVKTVR